MGILKFGRAIFVMTYLAGGGLAASVSVLAADPLPLPFVIDSTRSDPNRPVRPFGEPYTGPLVDTHSHLVPRVPQYKQAGEPNVLEAIAKAQVDRVVLLPPPNDAHFPNRDISRQRLDLPRTSGGRVLVMCGSDYLTVWMHTAAHSIFGTVSDETSKKMAQLTSDLKGGMCSGAGEIGFLHFNKTGRQPVVQLPAAYPPLLEIAETVARAGAWLDLHAEPVEPNGKSHEAEVFGTIALMFQRAPNLRLIYSHHALTNAHNARALLTAFPNLIMNFTYFRNPGEWGHLEPMTDTDGHLYADWAALLEEMPERFMIGADFMFGWATNPTEGYARVIRVERRMLGSLAPDAARRIAYENTERVFGPLPK